MFAAPKSQSNKSKKAPASPKTDSLPASKPKSGFRSWFTKSEKSNTGKTGPQQRAELQEQDSPLLSVGGRALGVAVNQRYHADPQTKPFTPKSSAAASQPNLASLAAPQITLRGNPAEKITEQQSSHASLRESLIEVTNSLAASRSSRLDDLSSILEQETPVHSRNETPAGALERARRTCDAQLARPSTPETASAREQLRELRATLKAGAAAGSAELRSSLASMLRRGSEEEALPPGNRALSSAEYEEFTREVAANIIQHYWKQWRDRKSEGSPAQRQKQQEGTQAEREEASLREGEQDADGSNDMSEVLGALDGYNGDLSPHSPSAQSQHSTAADLTPQGAQTWSHHFASRMAGSPLPGPQRADSPDLFASGTRHSSMRPSAQLRLTHREDFQTASSPVGCHDRQASPRQQKLDAVCSFGDNRISLGLSPRNEAEGRGTNSFQASDMALEDRPAVGQAAALPSLCRSRNSSDRLRRLTQQRGVLRPLRTDPNADRPSAAAFAAVEPSRQQQAEGRSEAEDVMGWMRGLEAEMGGRQSPTAAIPGTGPGRTASRGTPTHFDHDAENQGFRGNNADGTISARSPLTAKDHGSPRSAAKPAVLAPFAAVHPAAVLAAAALQQQAAVVADAPQRAARDGAAGRVSMEKLANILEYLDTIEEQAQQEVGTAAAGKGAPAVPVAAAGAGGAMSLPMQAPAQSTGSMAPAGSAAALQTDAADVHDTASTTGAAERNSARQGGEASAPLAVAVYEGVRAKMQGLQQELAAREAAVAAVRDELQEARRREAAALAAAERRQKEALEAQKREHEATVARQLGFVDRLLKDKDALTTKCTELAAQCQAAQQKAAQQVAALKEGWAGELKRAKEGWAAAERGRREAWLAEKTLEVKEVTIKGLEPEIQRLIAKHKADLRQLEEKAAEDTRRALDEQAGKQEAYVREVRERLLRERDDACERERSAAQDRLREAAERYEGQMQAMRLRMVTDADMRLEAAEAAGKEERRRQEEALGRAKREAAEREAQLRGDLEREKEVLRRQHEREMAALREEIDTNQEGWRAAVAGRARKELEAREKALREKLTKERDQELEVVVERLATEAAVAREGYEKGARAREEALAAKHAQELREAKRAEAKLAERYRLAGQAQAESAERAARAEERVEALEQELAARERVVERLQTRCAEVETRLAAHEADIQAALRAQEQQHQQALQALQAERQQLRAEVAAALGEADTARQRKAAEMEHVEARVRAAIARKDDAIAGLREQLAATLQRLRATEAVLQQQQADLCR